MLLTPNPTSPFVYTGSAANIYMIICFVDLWILITGKGGEKLAFRMTLIALPFAIYLHTTTAFVLALNKSRELWNSAVMVPIFLTSATASGIALLMICAYIMQRFERARSSSRACSGACRRCSRRSSSSTCSCCVVEILVDLLADVGQAGPHDPLRRVHHRRLRVGVPAGARPGHHGVRAARRAQDAAPARHPAHGRVDVRRRHLPQALLAHGDGLRDQPARPVHAAVLPEPRRGTASRSASSRSACSS